MKKLKALKTKTGGVFQLINVQTNSFTYRLALARHYLAQINIPWPFFSLQLLLLLLLRLLSGGNSENLKRLRNELRNGLTHNLNAHGLFIGILFSVFSFFFFFFLSKWFLLTFCVRYTQVRGSSTGGGSSPAHISIWLCHWETPAHSLRPDPNHFVPFRSDPIRSEPQRAQAKENLTEPGVNCMPCVNAKRPSSYPVGPPLIFWYSSWKLFLVEVCLLIVRRKQPTD